MFCTVTFTRDFYTDISMFSSIMYDYCNLNNFLGSVLPKEVRLNLPRDNRKNT